MKTGEQTSVIIVEESGSIKVAQLTRAEYLEEYLERSVLTTLHDNLMEVAKTGSSLVIDFSGVERISVVVFRTMVTIEQYLKTCNSRLILCGMCPGVSAVFDTMRTNMAFVIVDNRSAAIERIKDE